MEDMMTGMPVDFKLDRYADKKTLAEIVGLLSPDATIYASWDGLARRLKTKDFAVIMDGDGVVKALIIAADGDLKCPYLSNVDTGDVVVACNEGKRSLRGEGVPSPTNPPSRSVGD